MFVVSNLRLEIAMEKNTLKKFFFLLWDKWDDWDVEWATGLSMAGNAQASPLMS